MNKTFMERALQLARRGVGMTSPNPAVGAVIVKGGQIVAEGWHKKAGDEHAEVIAINQVMRKSGIVTVSIDPSLFRNAILYVTLEPCSHHGKTAPCAELVAECGFKKVVVGMKDPYEEVNGKGIRLLKRSGTVVEVLKSSDPLAREIREINQPFIKWASTGMPHVRLKAGMTLDGKIATSEGDSKWITSEDARTDARLERGKSDAVLVGAGTVMADDPELAPHGKFKSRRLMRVVVDGELSCATDLKVFRDEDVFVACCDKASVARQNKYKKAGIVFKSFGKDSVDFRKLLAFLGKNGVQSIFVEGGSRVNGALFEGQLKHKDMVDSVLFYLAPKLIGGTDSLSVIGGSGAPKMKQVVELENLDCEVIKGIELKLSGNVNFY